MQTVDFSHGVTNTSQELLSELDAKVQCPQSCSEYCQTAKSQMSFAKVCTLASDFSEQSTLLTFISRPLLTLLPVPSQQKKTT